MFGLSALVSTPGVLAGCHRDYDEAVTVWHRNATSLTHAVPTTETERAVLARAGEVGLDRTVLVIADDTVTFEPTYTSAAGRRCRAFRVEAMTAMTTTTTTTTTAPGPAAAPPPSRLLCDEGGGWVLVPDLLEHGTSDGPEDEL